MDRLEAFRNLSEHAWFGRYYAKLTAVSRKTAVEFIEAHTARSHDEFIPLVNRMFLDKSRPKQWELIIDLLTAAAIASKDSQVKTNKQNL